MSQASPSRSCLLPPARDNLVVRAAELLRTQTGVDRGAEIQLVKRIPSAAGLGGGSSDAAAALLAVNKAWDTRLPRSELMRLAAQLGSDVPFFLGQGAAICRGRGEQVEPVSGMGGVWFVLASPPHGLSTADVFARAEVPVRPRSVGPLVDALRRRDWSRIGPLLHNRLFAAAAGMSPWIERLLRALALEGLDGQQMSGSGSVCFGICRSARQASRVARRLRQCGWSNSVAAVSYA